MLKVICIDSSNRPKRVSPYEWIEEGVVYNVVEIAKMGLSAGKFGYKLKEVQLSEQSFPYEYYNAERFIQVETLIQVAEEQISADLELV